jgi:hypothetical protein
MGAMHTLPWYEGHGSYGIWVISLASALVGCLLAKSRVQLVERVINDGSGGCILREGVWHHDA